MPVASTCCLAVLSKARAGGPFHCARERPGKSYRGWLHYFRMEGNQQTKADQQRGANRKLLCVQGFVFGLESWQGLNIHEYHGIMEHFTAEWCKPMRQTSAMHFALCLTKWFSHFSQFFGHYVNPKYLMLVGRWGTLVPPFCRQQPPWVLPFCRCPHTIL